MYYSSSSIIFNETSLILNNNIENNIKLYRKNLININNLNQKKKRSIKQSSMDF